MDDFTDELKEIRRSKIKYLYLLVFFTVVAFGLLSNNINHFYLIFFTIGLIIITIAFEKLEHELSVQKMKNLYTKTKLSLKIEEIEKMIKKQNSKYVDKIMKDLYEEIK